MKMIVYLKSGASFEVPTKSVKTTNDGKGGFGGITWETPSFWGVKLHDIDVKEIAAIVVERPWWRRIFR